MHHAQGWAQDDQESKGNNAECGKSWGMYRMSQHSLRVLWDVTIGARGEASETSGEAGGQTMTGMYQVQVGSERLKL